MVMWFSAVGREGEEREGGEKGRAGKGEGRGRGGEGGRKCQSFHSSYTNKSKI